MTSPKARQKQKLYMYIYPRDNSIIKKWRVSLPPHNGQQRAYLGNFLSVEAALAARDARLTELGIPIPDGPHATEAKEE